MTVSHMVEEKNSNFYTNQQHSNTEDKPGEGVSTESLEDSEAVRKLSVEPDCNIYRLYFSDPSSRHPSTLMESPRDIVTREPRRAKDFYKVVVVGDYAVGKSSIVSRFCEDFFREAHATTVGVDYKIRTITLPQDKKKIKLELFDTAGLDKYRTVASNYYQNASGVAVVYDITDEQSFENVSNYLRELKFFIPPDAEMILLGNKADLSSEGERRVLYKTADEYSEKMGLSLFEVSAKTGENIEDAFIELASRIREKLELGTYDEKALDGSGIFVNGDGEKGSGEPSLELDGEAQKSKSSWFFWCCAN